MNDMSGKFEATDTSSPSRPKSLEDAGHIFRGKFLDKCAVVERWAVAVLIAAGQKPKASYLFGQKIAAVRKIAESEPTRLKSAKRVLDLLGRLEPYAELRSALAHSVLEIEVDSEGSGIFVFENVSYAPQDAWYGRWVFKEKELCNITGQISALANQLSQQLSVPRGS